MEAMLAVGIMNWTCLHRRASGMSSASNWADRGSGTRPTGMWMTLTLRGYVRDRWSHNSIVLIIRISRNEIDGPDPVTSISNEDQNLDVERTTDLQALQTLAIKRGPSSASNRGNGGRQ